MDRGGTAIFHTTTEEQSEMVLLLNSCSYTALESPYSNSRNPIFTLKHGFRSFTPLKENFFRGQSHPDEIRDYSSYIKIRERQKGILSSLKEKQRKLIDRLSPSRLQCLSKIENTKSLIDINRLVRVVQSINYIAKVRTQERV
jgi:hypothetical protein